MMKKDNNTTLYNNSILAMALYISYLSSANTDFYNLYWENNVLAFQDFDGMDGAIAFNDTGSCGFVSVRDNDFCFTNIETAIDITEDCIYRNSKHKEKAPLMEATFEYMQVDLEDLLDIKRVSPIISSWVWVEDGVITGNHVDQMIEENTLLRCLLTRSDKELKAYMDEEYELEDYQFAFAEQIVDVKTGSDSTISMTDSFWICCRNPSILKDALQRFGISVQ